MLSVGARRVLARTASAQLHFERRLGATAHAARGQGVHFVLPSEQATEDLASILAGVAVAGDAYLLDGALGAGKSAFRCAGRHTSAVSATAKHVCRLQRS